MRDSEFIELYKEVTAMHTKIYRQRTPEYVYDRWWKLLILIRFSQSDPMYGRFSEDFSRATKLILRTARLERLQGLLLTHLQGERIRNQAGSPFIDWKHANIYGRKYIYSAVNADLYPAMVSSNCHYIIDYHDRSTE